MKLKKNYVLRNVAGSWIVLPLGEETIRFNGMIRLNETAAFLWKELETEKDIPALVQRLTEEYEVSYEQAENSVKTFIDTMKQIGCIM